MEPAQISFVTDIAAEADAAKEAGWSSVLVDRPGNAALAPSVRHPVVERLTDMPATAAEALLSGGAANGAANGHSH